MGFEENKKYECPTCKEDVGEEDEFCANCGTLFVEGFKCENHQAVEAEFVCVICCMPYCEKCGTKVNGKFFCDQHSDYEIYEGMARVFGVNDTVQANYVADCLTQGGLHPFVFSRKASPLHMGAGDYTLFRASGELPDHSINEIKVMVPLQEVIQAEEIIKDLDIE